MKARKSTSTDSSLAKNSVGPVVGLSRFRVARALLLFLLGTLLSFPDAQLTEVGARETIKAPPASDAVKADRRPDQLEKRLRVCVEKNLIDEQAASAVMRRCSSCGVRNNALHDLDKIRRDVNLKGLQDAVFKKMSEQLAKINDENIWSNKDAARNLLIGQLTELSKKIPVLRRPGQPNIFIADDSDVDRIIADFLNDPLPLNRAALEAAFPGSSVGTTKALKRAILQSKDPNFFAKSIADNEAAIKALQESAASLNIAFDDTSRSSTRALSMDQSPALRAVLAEQPEYLDILCPDLTSPFISDLIKKITQGADADALTALLDKMYSRQDKIYKRIRSTVEAILFDIRSQKPPATDSEANYSGAHQSALKGLKELCTTLGTPSCPDEKTLKLWLGLEYLDGLSMSEDGKQILPRDQFFGYAVKKLQAFTKLIEKLKTNEKNGGALFTQLKLLAGENGGKDSHEVLRYLALMSRNPEAQMDNIIANLEQLPLNAVRTGVRDTVPNGFDYCPETGVVVAETEHFFKAFNGFQR